MGMMNIDKMYMRRALDLARNGELDASPNPMVGAVIVSSEGIIIGEGWHRRCGEGHAEVNAIASVKNKDMLRDSAMYVTLEPCSHYGKTPPCAELIVNSGIPRVVIGCLDPFAKVAGRGVARLVESGVEVSTGVLEKECRELNRKFITACECQRPYITLKWAQSADGFIDGDISTPLTLTSVHKLRATHDAILVGSGTVLADNPSLTTRFYAGRSPLKVVLDRRNRVSSDAIIFNGDKPLVLRKTSTIREVVDELYRRGVTSVLVEGGAEIHKSFIKTGFWDEIRVEVSDKKTCGNIPAPELPGASVVTSVELIDSHKIITYIK